MKVPDENLDLLKRVDTTLLYPKFLELINTLLNNCADRGWYYVATSGTRTFAQQNELYAQGRTKPGKICTNATGGKSNHNYTLALDFAPHIGEWKGKLNPDYSEKNYKVLIEECKKVGLESGATWTTIKDLPHVQLPYKKHGITLAKLKSVYEKGGMVGVWKFLDQFPW